MCKAVEEYGKIQRLEGERETKIKMIRNLLEENVPFEIALKSAGIDKKTYEKYSSEMKQ